MDVTCERCGTEYEFDETLVAARGTTVKCTHCGHLFKVFRPGSGPVNESRVWTVRRAHGGPSETIESLKELQRRIMLGELTPDDQISRGGEAWKRLGDIAELQTFFVAARAGQNTPLHDTIAAHAGRGPHGSGDRAHEPRALAPPFEATVRSPPAPPPPPAQPGKSTLLGVGAPRTETSEGPHPQPADSARLAPSKTAQTGNEWAPGPDPSGSPSVLGVPGTAPPVTASPRAAPPSSRPPPSPATRPGALPAVPPPPRVPRGAETLLEVPPSSPPPPPKVPPRTRSERPPPPSAVAETSVRRPSERPSVQPSLRPLRMEEDDAIPHLPRGRSRSGLWLSLVVLLAIGAGVYAARDRIAALVGAGGSPEDPAAPFVASGDRSLRRDHPDAYEEAITQYTKALAFREHHPRALAGLSRAHALIAQEQIFEAQVLEARASDDPALRGEAASLRRQAREHAERALECAETAVRHASSDAEVEVALGDALRLSGDRTHARSRLDRVRTMEGAPSAEALRVEALLVADEAGSLAAARPIAERAVAEDPSLLRARLLLARAQLAAGDTASARAQLQAVLDRAPDHPTARALLEQLGAGAVALPTAPAPGGSLIPRSLPSATATGPGISTSTAPVAPSQTGSGTAMSTSTGTPSTANVPAHDVRGGPGGATAERGGETDLRGRDYEALIREAETRLENGDTRRARALYEQALRERPGGVEAMTGIGFVLLAEGEVRGAVSQFQSAAERGYADAYIGLGDAYRRLGDRERALQAYEAYLERHSAGPKASIARRQAERLRAELARTESAFGGGAGGGPSGGSGQAGTPGSDTPVTRPEELPAPRGSTTPPPRDVPGDIPSIESEP